MGHIILKLLPGPGSFILKIVIIVMVVCELKKKKAGTFAGVVDAAHPDCKSLGS